MKITAKRVLLTGASGGIGEALAKELALRGAHLILHGRRLEVLEAQKLQLANPQNHQVVVADLSCESGRQALLQHPALNEKIDILINNAGVNQFAWLEDQTAAQIEQQLRLNIEAPIMLSKSLLEKLNKPGIIMNIGSSFGAIGYPGYSIYCATKFALRGFSEALGRELCGSGISVLYFAPRASKTALNPPNVYALNEKLGIKADTAEFVAEQAMRSLDEELRRTWLGWPEKFLVRLNALLPAVVDKVLAAQLATIKAFAKLG
ncbi:MAG: SDR family oxidoreductase [Vibrionaceae bacterium]